MKGVCAVFLVLLGHQALADHDIVPEDNLRVTFAPAKMCPSKITEACSSKGGFCVHEPFQDNCGNGTLKERACTSKYCQCCIPAREPSCDGKITSKCKKKGGSCVTAPFKSNCDGKLSTKLCKGKDCQCCIPIKAPTCDGKITNACTKNGGSCVLAPFGDNCQDGKLLKNACKGKDCQCCVPEKAPTCEGKLLNSCAKKGGHCVLAPFQDNCRGRLIERACTGPNCQCCIPDPTPAPTQPPTPAPTKVQTHAATKPLPTQAPTQPPKPPPTQPPTTPAPPKPTTQPPTQPPTKPPTTPAPPKPTTQPPTPPPIQSLPTQAPTQPPTPAPTNPPITAPPQPTTVAPKPACYTNSACMFPFIYNGVTYTQCTFQDHTTEWCATDTDDSYNYIEGEWTECHEKCADLTPAPTVAPTQAPTPAPTNPPTTPAPPQPKTVAPKTACYTNSACMFPFIYNGVTYTQCTFQDHTTEWCATDTDDSYNSIEGEWTECHEKCADPTPAPTAAPTQPPTPAPEPRPTQARTKPPTPAATNPPTTPAPPQPKTEAPKPAAPCPEYFSLQGCQCLHVNTVDTLTWEEARDTCAAKGNRLLVPKDVNEFKEFANAHYNGKQFWLGASDLESEGHWEWLNGEPLQAGFPWAMFQPDNWFNEDCLMYPHFGAYNDFQCSHKMHYICEACPTGYVLVGAQCLSFNTEEELTWQEASDKCQVNGDSLAVVKDFGHLQQYIELNYGGAGEIYFWLGGRKSQQQVTWRDDSQCGHAFPLANGAPSTCNPNGGNPCCSSHNWCGASDEHCNCSDCKDFTGAPLTRYYGPQSKIWHDDECKNIGVHSDKSVTECKAICDTTSGCTAINYKEDMCVLRECTSPVPQPMWDYSPWVGYSKVSSDWVWVNGGDMSNIPWGPFEPNNVDGEEECFNFVNAHGYNDDICSKKSFFICSNGL